jgi:hypothetical protein
MKKGMWVLLAVLCLSVAAAQKLPPAKPQLPVAPTPPMQVLLPHLIISDLKVNQNGESYVFELGYKNAGPGVLPKAADMPVKPDFRTLIDGREINRGFLHVPDSGAASGWENPSYYIGRVQLSSASAFDYAWFLGTMVTVKINENHAAGNTSDSQTYNLRSMALTGSYDLMLAGASMDWAKETLTVTVRIQGPTGNMTKFQLFESTVPFNFSGDHDVVPGQQFYTITQKLKNISYSHSEYSPYLLVLPRHGDKSLDVRDIDHRNNEARYTFHK